MSRIKDFFKNKIREPYRLIVRNDATLEVKVSFVLTPLNVILLASGTLVLFTFIVLSIFIYSPLSEFMPLQDGDNDLRQKIELQTRLDSLERNSRILSKERDNLLSILRGTPIKGLLNERDSIIVTENTDLEKVNDEEIKYRKMMEEDFAGDPFSEEQSIAVSTLNNLAFFTPLRGHITDTFSQHEHLAVDIVAERNAPVKATLSGTVVISSWTPETGHVMILQHSNDLISVYKHNSVLLKKVGTYVNAGEVIALVGNSGELTTGPHLHFELWYNGSSVDPRNYLTF